MSETIKQVTASAVKTSPRKLSVRVGMCRAIFTKYLAPSAVRGSRVKAHDSEGNSVTISYDSGLQRDGIYALAARKLCEKMEWTGELVGGGTPEGNVFVFVEPAPASVVIQCANQEDAEWIGKICAKQIGNEEQSIAGCRAGILQAAIQRAESVKVGL